MQPYYDHEGITIYHGDCREVLPTLGRFDLILTDPPYGIGIANNPVRQAYARESWDENPVSGRLLEEAIEKGEEAIIWGANYFGLAGQCYLVWDKQQPAPTLADCELAWTTLSRPAKIYRRRVVGYYKRHPTEKPLELMQWCLGLVPDAGTVLDPFMGSGTTLEAAKLAGMKATGIELSERYCEAAARRLEQGVLPLSG